MEVPVEELATTNLGDRFINDRQSIVGCTRRWCYLAAEAVLDPYCQVFQTPGIDGLISYRKAGGCLLVYGDPVCAPQDFAALTQAFHNQANQKKRPIIYVTASERFAKWSIQHECQGLIEFGEELFLDPHDDPRARTGVNASLVRRKVRHAEKEGVVTTEYLTHDLELEKEIENVGNAWLKSRKGPQLYLSRIRLFDDRVGKRWIYAKKGNKVVGILCLNQLQVREGYLLNRLMITPEASHGTPEMLVVTALDILRDEGCHFCTFGPIAGLQLGEIRGLSNISQWIANKAYNGAKKIFKLDGHRKFWEKYHPQSQRTYILFSRPSIGIKEVLCLARGFNLTI